MAIRFTIRDRADGTKKTVLAPGRHDRAGQAKLMAAIEMCSAVKLVERRTKKAA